MSDSDVIQQIEQMRLMLDEFAEEWRDLDVRSRVLRLVDLIQKARDLSVLVLKESGIDAGGARDRLRLYLSANVGKVIGDRELEIVGGISEYGRRVRELRVEEGYEIVTGKDDHPQFDLKPNEYVLLEAEPDKPAAARWETANEIRNMDGIGARDRILLFLKEHVGEVVTSEELAYVANIKEWARRVRELRTEEGYLIRTRLTGRPDLGNEEYVLEALERATEPHDRRIPTSTLQFVYERDNNTCQICGWHRELFTPDDPRRLEVHHRMEHAEGGPNDPDNLIVLCDRCHVQVHSGEEQLRSDD